MSEQAAKVISIEPLDNKDAKWLNLIKINYEDAQGKVRVWEATRRTTTPKNSLVDAVHVVAVRSRPTGKEVLLEKQFRAPTGKVCVEFPAGLMDEGETAEQCALRELREETGYIGEAIAEPTGTRTVLMSTPAASSAKTFMIRVKIDPDRPENQNPAAQLEEGEFIQSFWVPLKDLYETCGKLQAEGLAIDGKVGTFAEGIEATKV